MQKAQGMHLVASGKVSIETKHLKSLKMSFSGKIFETGKTSENKGKKGWKIFRGKKRNGKFSASNTTNKYGEKCIQYRCAKLLNLLPT